MDRPWGQDCVVSAPGSQRSIAASDTRDPWQLPGDLAGYRRHPGDIRVPIEDGLHVGCVILLPVARNSDLEPYDATGGRRAGSG